MGKFTYTKKQKADFEAELIKYKEVLNILVGVFAFTLSFTCLETKYPNLSAGICFVLVGLLMAYARSHYPSALALLQDMDSLDEKEKLLITGLKNKYFGWRGLLKDFYIFAFGYACLTAVFAFGDKLKPYFFP